MLYGIINPKISILVSVLSGAGFVVVLTFTPTKNLHYQHTKEISSQNSFETIQTKDQIEDTSKQNINNSEKSQGYDPSYFNVNPSSLSTPEKFETEVYVSRSTPNLIQSSPFSYLQNYVPLNGESSLLYKGENLQVLSVVGSKTSFGNGGKIYNPNDLLQKENQSNLKLTDISYSITPLLSAVVRTLNSENPEDRFKENTSAYAGIGLSTGKSFSSKIVAGDTVSSLNNYTYISQMPVVVPSNKTDFMRNVEGQTPQGKTIEWQTSVMPSKSVRMQASVFNSRKDQLADLNSIDGERFSVLLNLKNIALNLRYNYINSESHKNPFFRSSEFRGSDFAAVGLTVFLDKNKNYSFYVGGNYSNILTSSVIDGISQNPFLLINSFNLNMGGLSQSNLPSTSSFSASFRGKPKASNTTFFVNFKNQYSKGTIYSNLGPFQVPILSQATFDYATALGLELSF